MAWCNCVILSVNVKLPTFRATTLWRPQLNNTAGFLAGLAWLGWYVGVLHGRQQRTQRLQDPEDQLTELWQGKDSLGPGLPHYFRQAQGYHWLGHWRRKKSAGVPWLGLLPRLSSWWGILVGWTQRYPKYFSQIISLDIPPKPELKLISKLFVLLYQVFLATAFLIGGRIGEFMTKTFARIVKHNPPYFIQIRSDRNYPYYYLWKTMITNKLTGKKLPLANYKPSVPVCFIYGEKNPFAWVGPKWTQYLKETQGCEIHGLAAGHWFMKDYKNFVLDAIRRVARRWSALIRHKSINLFIKCSRVVGTVRSRQPT